MNISLEVLTKAKQIAPWFWPSDPWSVDISCAQGQQRAIAEATRILEALKAQQGV